MSTTASRRHKSDDVPTGARYKYKTVKTSRRRRASVLDRLQADGWELESETPTRFRTALRFRREMPRRRWGPWTATGGLALLVALGLVFALTRIPFHQDPQAKVRHDAASALEALDEGNLPALDQRLASYRGRADFAYYFTSQATPRALGDALSSVGGSSKDAPLAAGVDAHAYDIDLADLAGTIALATHGTGHRALPTSWTQNFIEATTTPETLYADESEGDAGSTERADQDQANQQNLLLLLSRGYWSIDFLRDVTAAYWDFDHSNGGTWPSATLDDAKYAPSPSGNYLTDGVLALTAALTANPAASEWAFTDFQPGTQTVTYDGSDHPVGTFTHYLFFEHHFPAPSSDSQDHSVGMTATLTALSAAVDATRGTADALDVSDGTPQADSLALQGFAKSLQPESGCSWDPRDYRHCVVAAADAAWHWVHLWGHSVLDILSSTTFAPPLDLVGVGAVATNATWYAIEGDYTEAGLSLASAVPGLSFVKIVKGAKVGVELERGAAAALDAEKASKESDEVARVANEWRAAANTRQARAALTAGDLRTRPALSASTKAEIRAAASKTASGDFIDPNTGAVIPRGGPFHYGHKPGYEWRCAKAKALVLGWSVEQLTAYFNDPAHFQIEDPASNLSHQYESDRCAA